MILYGEDIPACRLVRDHVVNAEVAIAMAFELSLVDLSFVVAAYDILGIFMTDISAEALNLCLDSVYFEWVRIVVDISKNAASTSISFDGLM